MNEILVTPGGRRPVSFWPVLPVAIVSLLVTPVAKAAPENLFPEGSFGNVGQDGKLLTKEGKPAEWWGLPTPGKVRIITKDGAHWLRLTNETPGQWAQCGRRLAVKPDWESLTVRVRLRAEKIKVGKNPWETAVIDFDIEDAAQQPVDKAKISIIEDTDWKEFSTRIVLKANAAYVHILPRLLNTTGVLDIADLRIFAEKLAWDEEEADAALPPPETLRWGEEPTEALSSRRGRICLNGIWQFVPMLDSSEGKPPGGVAYIRVPGTWQPAWPVPGLVSERGRGPAWKRWEGTSCAWYLRKIRIPPQWAGRAILLRLSRVSTDAIVYANGKKCGSINWPAGEVDLSGAVRPGEEAALWVQVLATTRGSASGFLDPGRPVTQRASLRSRGLIGDVFLCSRPREAHVSDVAVRTSTRKKEVTLEVELRGVKQAGNVQLAAKMLDQQGKVERRFTAEAAVTADRTQSVSVSWSWADPRLWDAGQPNLYTLRLEVKGAGIDDEYAQPFGFREFWIDGRRFFLNGSEIRLRPTSHQYVETCFSGSTELIDAHLDGCIRAGFNTEECWPVDHDERGSLNFRDLLADRADRKGFLLIGTALPINRGQWSTPGYQQTWEERMARDLRRYYNHPSVIIWTTNPNWLGHGLDQHPLYIGRKRQVADGGWRASAAVAEEGVSAIKRIDPTRPVLNHAGCCVGDIYNINCYLNLTPLQEREEWLSQWAASGDMPFMAVEFGTPWKYTFMRNRWGMDAGTSEPLMTEYCAIYQGPEAYQLETAAYRKAIRNKHNGGMSYSDWSQDTIIDAAPAFQKLQALFNRNTYRSWRTWGASGGMIPWDYGYGWDTFWNERRRKGIPDVTEQLKLFVPGMRGTVVAGAIKANTKPFSPEGTDVYPAGEALMEANGPTLAWIAGGAEAFTAKDHSFAAGQEVQKQAVLVNDERSARDYAYGWQVTVEGRETAGHSGQGRLEPAETLFVPLSFRAPAVVGKAKAEGSIGLSARIGTRRHQDRFAFRVFAPPQPLSATVALYDPQGKSRPMLQALGCTVEQWSPSSQGLIVIGREALSSGPPLPFDLEATVRGGRRVLILTQDPQWLGRQMGFRVAAQLSRRVFAVDGEHPLMHDLDAEDLRDWRGQSTLVEAYPPPELQKPAWRSPVHGFHWGNRGALSSAALEKPHRSGWRPLLQCEFDLAYTPLMELDWGQGRLTLCTLDLEDHVAFDPAAGVLAGNLIRYAATAPLYPRAQRTILLGDEQDRKLLDLLGVAYAASPRIEPQADLVILGRPAKCDETQIRGYVQRGGHVLLLAQSSPAAGLGVELVQSRSFAGSLQVPSWAECRGLGVSDLHWRSETGAWLVKGGAEVGAEGLLGRVREGKGVAVFCQMDPERLEAESKTYFRLTRWRQTRALAQLLANLGASFKADECGVGLKSPPSGLYHPDYRQDFESGDDPYRYFRW